VRQSEKERTYSRLNKAQNFIFHKRRQCKKEEDETKSYYQIFYIGRLQTIYARCHYGPTAVGREKEGTDDNSCCREPAAETMEILKN